MPINCSEWLFVHDWIHTFAGYSSVMALLLLFAHTVSSNTKRVYYIKQEYYDLEFVKTFVFNLEKKPRIKPLILAYNARVLPFQLHNSHQF